MSALVVTIARFGLLLLLWLFIFFVLATVRNDIYGGTIKSAKKQKYANALRANNSSKNKNIATSPVAPYPKEPMLCVIQGALAGTTIRIGNSPISVGRSPDSSLVLDDGYASARHARFYLRNGKVILEDLDSTNGTWVNNQQIHDEITLTPGMYVTIGKTILELR